MFKTALTDQGDFLGFWIGLNNKTTPTS